MSRRCLPDWRNACNAHMSVRLHVTKHQERKKDTWPINIDVEWSVPFDVVRKLCFVTIFRNVCVIIGEGSCKLATGLCKVWNTCKENEGNNIMNTKCEKEHNTR